MPHVVLLGDSIFDNRAYTNGGPDFVTQLRDVLPPDWDASLAAIDGHVTKDIARGYRDLLARQASTDIGFNSLMGYYLTNPSERTRAVAERLEDLGDRRLADMDASGIDVQILSLTSPGVGSLPLSSGSALLHSPRRP